MKKGRMFFRVCTALSVRFCSAVCVFSLLMRNNGSWSTYTLDFSISDGNLPVQSGQRRTYTGGESGAESYIGLVYLCACMLVDG